MFKFWKAKRKFDKIHQAILAGAFRLNADERTGFEKAAELLSRVYAVINQANGNEYVPCVADSSEVGAVSPVRWEEMIRLPRMLEGAQRAVNNGYLNQVNQVIALLDSWIAESDYIRLLFPATTIETLKIKYAGMPIDLEALEHHSADEWYGYNDDVDVWWYSKKRNSVNFSMIWNNRGTPDYLTCVVPLQAYIADVELTLDKDNALLDVPAFTCNILVDPGAKTELGIITDKNKWNKDDFTGKPCELSDIHFMRLDALLARTLVEIAPKDVVWAHDITEFKGKRVHVSPRTEADDQLERYCPRPSFNIRCDAVAHCCGECPMLKWMLDELFPAALDTDSLARVRTFVSAQGMFSKKDAAGEYICFDACPKNGSCQVSVRKAIDEIYRNYYEIERNLK